MKSTHERRFFPYHPTLGTQKCETDADNKTYRFRENKREVVVEKELHKAPCNNVDEFKRRNAEPTKSYIKDRIMYDSRYIVLKADNIKLHCLEAHTWMVKL